MTSTKPTVDEQAENQLRDVLRRAYPTPQTRPSLHARLATIAAQHTYSPAPYAVLRRRLILGTVAAAIAITLGVQGQTRMQAAQAGSLIQRVGQAMERVNTAYVVEWQPSSERSRVRIYRQWWYSNHRLRIDDQVTEDDGLTQLMCNGRKYEYHRREKIVNVTTDSFDYKPPLLSLTDLIRSSQVNRIEERVHLLPDAVVAGRSARRVLLDLPPCLPGQAPVFTNEETPVRAIITVDPETDLPFRTETQAFQGDWRTVLVVDARYNEPVPEDLFATDFPGATVRDEEQLKAAAREEFHQLIAKGNGGHGRKTVGNRTVTFSIVESTAIGYAFALYRVSGPAVPDGKQTPWGVELRDRTARRWELVANQAVGSVLPDRAKRWTFDGERLYVAWFRPDRRVLSEEQGSWQMTVRFDDATSVTLSPEETRLSGLTLPDGEPYDEFLVESAATLAQAARDKAEWSLNGNWRADKEMLRAILTRGFDASSWAVDWYKEAIQIEDRAARLTGRAVNHADDLKKIATLLEQQGKTAEADAVRRQANVTSQR